MAHLKYTYAAMSSGKSTHLLQAAFNHRALGLGVVLLTARIDNRYGEGMITSRLGISQPANTFDTDTVMDERLVMQDTVCLFVDEVHFATEKQIQDLHKLAHRRKINIECYGLRSDFLGYPFAGSAALMSLADAISPLETVCQCGQRATMNSRWNDAGERVQQGEQIQIGGNAHYRAMCPPCFYGYREGAKSLIPINF